LELEIVEELAEDVADEIPISKVPVLELPSTFG
jgi:hypothetical protein